MTVAGSRYGLESDADGRAMRVQRGIYVLRYAESSAGLDAPEVHISVPPGSAVEFVSLEPTRQAVLSMPRDALVLRSTEDSAVLVKIVSKRAGGSQDAHINLERVTASTPSAIGYATLGANAARGTQSAPALSILAHVARRGDVLADGDEWICGPQFPMAIEGVELRWPSASGVEIMTSAVINARGRKALPPVPAGTFVGTRGKAAPLVGLTFMLTGPMASRYQLSCEALFLGAPVTSLSGSLVELAGPTGYEPLVGLKLSLIPNLAASAHSYTPRGTVVGLTQPQFAPERETFTSSKAAPAAESASRIRVFRTSRRRADNSSL